MRFLLWLFSFWFLPPALTKDQTKEREQESKEEVQRRRRQQRRERLMCVRRIPFPTTNGDNDNALQRAYDWCW